MKHIDLLLCDREVLKTLKTDYEREIFKEWLGLRNENIETTGEVDFIPFEDYIKWIEEGEL